MEEVVNSVNVSSAVIDFSLVSLFLKADLVVKSVIIILILASIYSWAIIVSKLIKKDSTIKFIIPKNIPINIEEIKNEINISILDIGAIKYTSK